MIGLIWHYLYNSFLRSWLKWILRKITGTCELQRILAGSSQGAEKTMKIEYSLVSSKSDVLRTSVTVSERGMATRVCDIMGVKNITPQKDPKFKLCLQICLLQISGYNTLYTDSENLRKQSFDSANVKHEDMLMKLWNILMPRIHLESRITKQWSDIGFQGDDPKTDFRGMGMLGLYNLVYFGEHYTEVARQILSHSNHPKIGYSYAIVGINLTEMAYSLLKSGALKAHFYNLVPGVPQMHHFHQFYCYLMYEFDKFWFKEEPQSIMEFNQYREQFHERVKELLKDPKAMLTLEFNK
ncbi:ELMO domain-containing protein 2 [Callorhinchus milii]|uniref:ELMO/CED-12 domain containing 2 n=1 Tax=Callorhinchus milii TaxID=7868 RepID=A0A4W3JYQ1_CALMI|nr:ELMO domain-containing protein 2 [Callorhinchus milii]XP_007895846.1 ELMO domain-containing protein 2 [Callorhinchus milii]XP_007895848.1 ELMO domain-containing protein 2 [Callorhinchus milii]|eukprot:gi/632959823/ref/XP_007895845.1/ PREDICTED: ELMO domain-containing protein 2 [Callorhinchus milii]